MLCPTLVAFSPQGAVWFYPVLCASNDQYNGPSELARICPQRVAWIGPSVRASSECELSTIFCEAAGVVSIARIDRAPPVIEQFELLQRARAASTETMPAVSPTLF